MKKLLLILVASAAIALGAASVRADDGASDTVIHVVTVSWKSGTSAQQIQAALDGAKALPSQFSGILHVWTHSLKVQGDMKNAIVMEFKDAAALKSYAGSDAQKAWYQVYQPIHEKSVTFDIGN